MKRHTVDLVMTREVVSVRPNATFKQIATTLAEHDISAVPVTDYQDRIIGIVSEADLLTARVQPEPRRFPWQRGNRTVKTVATDLMTTPAITVGTGTTITNAARLLAARGIKRVPVVDAENRLLGIVSRHDLVRVFTRPDDEIKTEISEDLFLHTLWIDPLTIDIRVAEGIVTLRGQVERRSLLPVAGTLCQRVNGVVDVVNELTYALDDSKVGDGTKPQNVGIIHGLR
jgi:CBS domain-containing protein